MPYLFRILPEAYIQTLVPVVQTVLWHVPGPRGLWTRVRYTYVEGKLANILAEFQFRVRRPSTRGHCRHQHGEYRQQVHLEQEVGKRNGETAGRRQQGNLEQEVGKRKGETAGRVFLWFKWLNCFKSNCLSNVTSFWSYIQITKHVLLINVLQGHSSLYHVVISLEFQ